MNSTPQRYFVYASILGSGVFCTQLLLADLIVTSNKTPNYYATRVRDTKKERPTPLAESALIHGASVETRENTPDSSTSINKNASSLPGYDCFPKKKYVSCKPSCGACQMCVNDESTLTMSCQPDTENPECSPNCGDTHCGRCEICLTLTSPTGSISRCQPDTTTPECSPNCGDLNCGPCETCLTITNPEGSSSVCQPDRSHPSCHSLRNNPTARSRDLL